jgi:hypothetical protein
MSYVEEVLFDEEHDCFLLPLNDELLSELGWEVGDTLIWCIEGEDVCLRKYEEPKDER